MVISLRNNIIVLITCFFVIPANLYSAEKKDSSAFNLVPFAMHHISDAYSWTFFENRKHEPCGFQLPRILWNKKEKKLEFFLNTTKAVQIGYIEEKNISPDANDGSLILPGYENQFRDLQEKIKNEKDKDKIKKYYKEQNSLRPLDFSITKNVLFLFIAAILLLIIFISIAKKYRKNPDIAPKGMQSAFEPIIVYIRDEIALYFHSV